MMGSTMMRRPDDVPDHPQLYAEKAAWLCLTEFPLGILVWESRVVVGDGPGQLLPGTYEFRREGDKRVPRNCELGLNENEDNHQSVEMPYGEPFIFRFYQYHGRVRLNGTCGGVLFRIGD